MNYDLDLLTLLRQANLPCIACETSYNDSMTYYIESISHAPHKIDSDEVLEALNNNMNEIIICLNVVNKKLNGDIPSSTIGGPLVVDHHLVMAVSQIINSCNFLLTSWVSQCDCPVVVLNRLAYIVWSISCAWNAVLHGDIDSLEDHIALESLAFNGRSKGKGKGDILNS